MVASFDSKIERTLRRQKKCTPQQKEKKVQDIEGIAIELSFEEEMVENETNMWTLRDFTLPEMQGSQTSIA